MLCNHRMLNRSNDSFSFYLMLMKLLLIRFLNTADFDNDFILCRITEMQQYSLTHTHSHNAQFASKQLASLICFCSVVVDFSAM